MIFYNGQCFSAVAFCLFLSVIANETTDHPQTASPSTVYPIEHHGLHTDTAQNDQPTSLDQIAYDANTTAVLECPLSHADPDHPIKWYNSKFALLATNTDYTVDDNNRTLTIIKVGANHHGAYYCSDGLTNKTLNIWVKPWVKKYEKSKNVIEDDPLQIECHAFGWPTPDLSWYFKDMMIIPVEGRISFKNGTTTQLINSIVRIEGMQFTDEGSYACVANNTYGMYNETQEVKVKDKLAALWPFLGICAEVAILCTIIFIYEKRRAKRMEEEEAKDEADHLAPTEKSTTNDEVRQRK